MDNRWQLNIMQAAALPLSTDEVRCSQRLVEAAIVGGHATDLPFFRRTALRAGEPGNAKISTPTTRGLHPTCNEDSADELESTPRPSAAVPGKGEQQMPVPLIAEAELSEGVICPRRPPTTNPPGMSWPVKLVTR